MLSVLSGLGLGLSLIIAIGAQNVYVLRQGLRREHVGIVVAICAVSDAVLIAAGVGGLGFVIQSAPWVVDAARLLGAAFLAVYGFLAARRAWRGTDQGISADAQTDPTTVTRRTRLAPVIATVLALTWLNPHVYLDTVLMLGSIAATHGEHRWLFALGAMVASGVWFTSLGFGARYLSRWLSTPRAWRVLDGVIALVMWAIAVSLIIPLITGANH